jgi:hypothetical protein
MVGIDITVSSAFYADLLNDTNPVSIDNFKNWVSDGTLEELGLAYFIYAGIDHKKADILYQLYYKKVNEMDLIPHRKTDHD